MYIFFPCDRDVRPSGHRNLDLGEEQEAPGVFEDLHDGGQV